VLIHQALIELMLFNIQQEEGSQKALVQFCFLSFNFIKKANGL
jgi:hypothetical protein